ncbi:MAG: DUF2066 domain-containing protein [Candidatus Wenzhouxiangella sp. M2_3B_020]
MVSTIGLPEWAAGEVELYVGEAPAVSSESGDRAPLLEALNQVLVRLTGRVGEDLVGEMDVDAETAAALALGRQYRREEVPRTGGGVVERRILRVDFDPGSVDRLLADSPYRRWGRERPEFLFWIVSDEGDGADYLSGEPVLQHVIDEAAFRYGIELTRPILDASDRLEVTPADIRGGFTGVAVPAMQRYGADGIIMLDLRRNRSFWTGRWAWRIADREAAFQRSGSDRAEVVRLGLGRIAESLASQFAIQPTRADSRRLVVSGIDTPAHYREVAVFLQQLTGVERVRVAAAEADAVVFEIRIATDGLRQRIELTGPLEFVRHDLVRDTLHYRFRL